MFQAAMEGVKDLTVLIVPFAALQVKPAVGIECSRFQKERRRHAFCIAC